MSNMFEKKKKIADEDDVHEGEMWKKARTVRSRC